MLGGTPHPVIVTIRDNRDYMRVLLYSYYTTSTGWGVLLTLRTWEIAKLRSSPAYLLQNIRRPWGACWMVSVTERVKTLFFSPLQPKNAGGGEGAGGGVGGVSRARFPPGPHLRSSRFSRLPPLRLPPTRRLFQNDETRGQIWASGPSRSGCLGPKPLGGRAPRP